jgi:hypothetical protein
MAEQTATIIKIFRELSTIAHMLEDDYLKSILDKVELISEEDLLKALKTYIIDFDSSIDDEEEDKYKRKWIRIGMNLFETKFLNEVGIRDEFPQFGEEMLYYIIINETTNVDFSIQNKKILFPSKEERDTEFEKIASRLDKLNIVVKS